MILNVAKLFIKKASSFGVRAKFQAAVNKVVVFDKNYFKKNKLNSLSQSELEDLRVRTTHHSSQGRVLLNLLGDVFSLFHSGLTGTLILKHV